MNNLNDILKGVKPVSTQGDTGIQISKIDFDSRKAVTDGIYVALPGTQVDGHNFIEDAVHSGAKAIVCEQLPKHFDDKATYIQVENSHEALAIMAANFYDNPSRKLKLVGITGTNGKTTIATLLFKLFSLQGKKCGLLSTVENFIGEEKIEATHTTPDPIQINRLLKQMVTSGCTHCFMEVSSHAVDQKRVFGLDYDLGIFTNITHDHLDYHKTFKKYIAAKKAFFDGLGNQSTALINTDDKNAGVMVQNTRARKQTYAIKKSADYNCKILELHFNGMHLLIDNVDVWVNFIGSFNASNLLAVFSASQILGMDANEALSQISKLSPVKGRLETFQNAQKITGIVDYAHTPDALVNVLNTIQKIKSAQQQIISVVGAGGNRDKSKRPLMAKAAYDLSDKLILTSDNPRFEEPESILKDMERGIGEHKNKLLVISDRKQAIKTACVIANHGDIILVAGKGHENYQEIKGVKYPFDDMKILTEYLNN